MRAAFQQDTQANRSPAAKMGPARADLPGGARRDPEGGRRSRQSEQGVMGGAAAEVGGHHGRRRHGDARPRL
eukprot:9359669-Pyramimonas_sp.AAC.1